MAKKLHVESFRFGSIVIDGKEYTKDIVIDGRAIKKRKKKGSKTYRDRFGHTPLSVDENIPWDCKRLVIGRGVSKALPVMEEVSREAASRGVELLLLSTDEALGYINKKDTNLVLHLTC
jgi:hypothetical protein